MNASRHYYKLLLLLVSLPVILQLNILTGSFQFDDQFTIVDGDFSHRIKNADLLWSFLREGGYFQRSVIWITLAANYHLGGLNTFGYHLFNILIHILNGLLVFFLCTRLHSLLPGKIGREFLSRNKSFILFPLLSALIFLLLPIQSETTAYITSRSSSLVTFFFLLGVLFFSRILFCKDRKLHPLKWTPWLLGISLCVLLGLGTKKSFFTFPFILFLVFYFHSGITFSSMLKKHKFLIVIIMLVSLTVLGMRVNTFYNECKRNPQLWQDGYNLEIEKGYVNSKSEFVLKKFLYSAFGISEGYRPDMYSPTAYLLTEMNVVPHYYLRKMAFPMELNISPDITLVKKMGWESVITFLGMAFVVIYACGLAKASPIIPLTIFWLFIILAPSSSFIPLYDLASEHRTYIASPAFAMFFGFLLSLVISKQRVSRFSLWKYGMLMAVFFLFAVNYVTRNEVWQNELGLWSDSARKSPHSARPHHNLGLAYSRNNQITMAISEYNKALEFERSADTYLNLAEAYKKLKMMEKAFKNLNAAVTVNPRSYQAHYNLGVLYHDVADFPNAIRFYNKAIEIQKESPAAYNNLGEIYTKQNQNDKAMQCYEKALEISPAHFASLNNIAILYQKKGDMKMAGRFYEKAVSTNPHSAEARLNIGVLYLIQGRLDLSEKHLREAIRLNPQFEPAFANLGDLLIKKKLFREAINIYGTALSIDPENPIIHRNLGVVYFNHLKETKKALYHFRRTLEIDPGQDYAVSIREILEKYSGGK